MTSKTTVLLVAGFLGLCALAGIACITVLSVTGHPVPASLETLTGTALGALAMTLGSSRSTLTAGDIEPTVVAGMVPVRPAEPTPVVVQQPDDDPIPAVLVDDDPQMAARRAG